MNKIALFVIPLLLMATSTFAYAEYSHNSNFDSNIDYLSLWNSANGSLSYAWNASCYNMTGCLLITTNYSQAYSIGMNNNLYPTTTLNDQSQLTNGTHLILPAKKEGIIALHYLFNASQANIPSLSITVADEPFYNYTYENATANTWHTTNVYIPPSDSLRYVKIIFVWIPDSPASILAVDRFAFYTYDKVEMRTDYFTTELDELERYCGGNTSNVFKTLAGGGLVKSNQTLNLAYLLDNSTTDNNICCAFQSGNTTIARRCSQLTFPTNTTPAALGWKARDLVLARTSAGNTNQMLIKSISTTSIKYDFYESICWGQSGSGYNGYLWFNGAGIVSWNQKWSETAGQLCKNATLSNEITSITNRNATGTKFNIGHDSPAYNTSWIDLFTFNEIVDNTGLNCDSALNQQYYVYPNGTIEPTSYQSCGSWGCNETTNTCVNGTLDIGSFCGDDGYSWYNRDINGTIVYHTCYPLECQEPVVTGNHYVSCLNRTTNTLSTCYNDAGNLMNCNNTVAPVNSTDFMTNPANGVAMVIGGMFGITVLETAQNVSALFLMAIIIISMMVIMAKFVGVHGKDSATVSLMLSAVLTIMFFAIGWLDAVIMIVLIILEGFMIARLVSI